MGYSHYNIINGGAASEDPQLIEEDTQLMRDLGTLFEVIFKNLKASECIRDKMNKRPKFDKYAAFRYCDRDNDGRISI